MRRILTILTLASILSMHLSAATLQDSSHVDWISRSPGGITSFVGLGVVGGLRIGIKYNTTTNSSIELAYGGIPFLELVGKRAHIVSVAYDYYFNADRVGSPFLSFLTSYDHGTTTSGRFDQDLYFVSSTLGIDFLYHSRINFFLRAGVLAAFGKGSKPQSAFNLDIGLGLAFY